MKGGDVIEKWGALFTFLREHPDVMHISADKRLAIMFYPPVDGIVFILGDFSGSDIECSIELHEGLVRILN